ncbi:MAG TPA: glycosyltransferase family 39 protein [Chitinophagaceae bacterium]|nr:glycosyltransferase family 39 protein [Chitinophagaceae bacterium]
MKAFLKQHHRVLFYSSWLAISLLQAFFTELLDDEAYYWVYSRFLDWGYFDHPPMTALLIKAGFTFIENELGVRLLFVLLSTATLLICELLLEKKNSALFYALCYSMAVLQIGGFLAVPDVAILFFTAVFFYCFKKFIQKESLWYAVILGVVAGLMMYSKYHAVLIILFTLLASPRLLAKPKIYLAGIVALALFLPHLWWQYDHNWMSFRYHLFESNNNRYKISYTTEYILGQLLLAGPLAGVILFWATIRHKPGSVVEKALKFTALGMIIFFFFSSFRGRVEANWTSPALIPLLVLSHSYLNEQTRCRKLLYRLVAPTLVLVITVRVLIAFNIAPVRAISERFHQYKNWPADFRTRTESLPVIFNSSYQRASKYWFYSGQATYSLNQYRSRRSNYNFWPIEEQLFGKEVYIADTDSAFADKSFFVTPLGKLYYFKEDNFHSFARLMFVPEQESLSCRKGDQLNFSVTISLPIKYYEYLTSATAGVYPVKIGVFTKEKWIKDIELPLPIRHFLQESKTVVTIDPQLSEGSYFLRFAVASDAGIYTHNSEKIPLQVN